MATVAQHESSNGVSSTFSRLAAIGDVWAAVAAATVSLVLGLYQLGQPSLWIDEAATFRATWSSYAHLTHQHHWIYYSMMKPWTGLAGTSEFALRLPSVFAAAAACALLVPFGNRLMGKPVGSLAGLVLALNPFVVQWSQQARSYTIVMLAAIVTTWLFVRLRADDSRRAWVFYTVALAVSVLLQPLSAGLLASAHFLAARGLRIRIATAGIAVLLATSIFLLGVGTRDASNGTLHWNVDPTVGSVSRAVLELSGALGVGLALSVLGLALVRRERLLLGCWAVVPLVISIVVTPLGKVFVDRYLIVSVPAFALLVSAAFLNLRGPWRLGAIGAFAAATVAGLVIWYTPDGSQNWRGEDWKSATAFANARGGAITSTSFGEYAFKYYGGIERNTGLVLMWSQSGNFTGHWPIDVGFGKRLRAQQRGAP